MDREMTKGEKALVILVAVALTVVVGWNIAKADPLEVEVGPYDEDGVAYHEIGDQLHVLSGMAPGDWTHHRDGGLLCFQTGPPPPAAHPDSIYFWPRKPRWVAMVSFGEQFPWATCNGLVPDWDWVNSEDAPGYVALYRETYQRYAVAFVYLLPDGRWDETWDWQIRQE